MDPNNNNKRKALGKGLEQLFSNERIDFDNFEREVVSEAKAKNGIVEIPIAEIRSNPYQPRKTFNDEALMELSASIKTHGVVQPIIVKKSIKGYELVAGERRTKASKIAGLSTIPAIIKEYNDQEMMEIALIENIQREDLNPIEEANALATIIKSTGMTQEEIGQKFSKSRSYVTNLLGLLKLPEQTKKSVIEGKISMGHARVLSKIEDQTRVLELTDKIIKENLSVREIENITSISNPRSTIKKATNTNPRYHIYESIMREKIGTKIKINNKKIEIPFDSEKDLERILEIINIQVEGE